MSNREPSLARRIAPAVALTGVGFVLVNALDRPDPMSGAAALGSATTVDPASTPTVAGDPSATTTLPASSNSVAAQGSGAQTPGSTAAPAATTPATSPATAAPAANDCGAITKTGAAATIVHRREYGTLQVTAKFTSAKELCAAEASYNVYESKSNRFNNYAIPILNDEAASAHSANIQGVSGATATSNAYVQSLQSAIDQL